MRFRTVVRAALPRRGHRRPGQLYALDVEDHVTGVVMVADYIGKTRQSLQARCNQHWVDQPFGDKVVRAYPIDAGYWTEAELDAREMAAIARWKPRLNYTGNRHNRHRIPIPVLRQQRWDRDRAAGRPPWVPPKERHLGPASAWVTWQRRLRPWHVWLGAWLALWVTGWRQSVLLGADVRWAPVLAAVVALGALGWGVWRGGQRRPKWLPRRVWQHKSR